MSRGYTRSVHRQRVGDSGNFQGDDGGGCDVAPRRPGRAQLVNKTRPRPGGRARGAGRNGNGRRIKECHSLLGTPCVFTGRNLIDAASN